MIVAAPASAAATAAEAAACASVGSACAKLAASFAAESVSWAAGAHPVDSRSCVARKSRSPRAAWSPGRFRGKVIGPWGLMMVN